MLDGIRTIPVTVEADISTGMPVLELVGFLSPEVREAKERVRTALHNSGIVLPAKRITVNLSPGNVRKNGTGFDLPITAALLAAMGALAEREVSRFLFVGELGLNGDILPVNGILPIVADGMERGIREFVVPKDNYPEACLIPEAQVYAFSSIREMIAFINEGTYAPPEPSEVPLRQTKTAETDFAEVNGQLFLKRACEVAAAGMHNMLMVGPPGAGKTMISERMSTILPPLTKQEQLELSKIYSVCGLLKNEKALVTRRPFRSPHHTISNIGLTGGGSVPRPGEISLAHCGVLFLDELTEFQKQTLEVLRQPLEDKEIRLVRAAGSVTYPAQFLLLAAMNPCNCGYYPDMNRCTCTPGTLRRYADRISQPLIDRIDICVEASAITYEELTVSAQNESSASIRSRVEACQNLQNERYAEENFTHNSRIPASKLALYCPLGDKEAAFMEDIFKKQALTARTYHKILRVARTIADLDHSKDIHLRHLTEAVCYRMPAKGYWGGAQ
jgi:magnesium chelatase family protein